MATNEEWVQLVDADNRPIGGTLRSEMRSKALRYRASYIFIFNCKGELFVQQRAHSKDKYPGWFDLAAGGVLREGEDYLSNAVREVEEETGITDLNITGEAFTTFHTYEAGGVVHLKTTFWYPMSHQGNLTPGTPQSVEGITDVTWLKPPFNEGVLSRTFGSIQTVLDELA